MKIKLKDVPDEGLLLEGKVSAENYDLPIDEHENWKEINYRLMVNILGTECLVVGEIWTEFKAPCARCLELLPMKIHVKNFHHSYNVAESAESIDLTQEIREDILLDLPFAPKCQLDADFRCPITGQTHREPDDKFAELNRESVWGELDNLKKKKKKE